MTVDHGGVGRHPPEVEAAVYISVLEAMQNVAKYAHASNVVVRLRRDRVAALGGTFDLRSTPGEGTTVLGRIPVTG